MSAKHDKSSNQRSRLLTQHQERPWGHGQWSHGLSCSGCTVVCWSQCYVYVLLRELRALSECSKCFQVPGASTLQLLSSTDDWSTLKTFPCFWRLPRVWFRLNSKFSPQIKEQFHKTKLCVRSPASSSFENRLRDWRYPEVWLLAKFLMNQVFNKKQKCSMGAQCPFAHSEEVREELFEVLIDLCFIKPTKNI